MELSVYVQDADVVDRCLLNMILTPTFTLHTHSQPIRSYYKNFPSSNLVS